MTRDFRRSLPLCPCLTLLLALIFADGAAAAIFTVSSLADSGPGSLRQAVLDANASAGADEVAFTVTGTITLTSGEIAITDELAVDGPGAEALTVSGSDQSRIFNVDNGAPGAIDVTLSGLTLTQGHAQGPGGAVLVADEDLTIRDSVISDSISDGLSASEPALGGNIAYLGGRFSGALRIENSTLTGGVATDGPGLDEGGNLYTRGVLILKHSVVSGGSANQGGGLSGGGYIRVSTVSGNTAHVGGGIYGEGLALEASTVSGNTAQLWGGGIFVQFATTARIVNSTISGNTAQDGGGIFFISSGDGAPGAFVDMRLTTVSNNMAVEEGGNISDDTGGGSVMIDHSIIANGVPTDTPSGFSFTANYSLIEDANPVLVFGSHNIIGVDPLLGPLTSNGGPSLTHALLPGSPAIDAGDPAIPSPPATDQRGFARIVGPAVDLGAVEAQPLGALDVPTLSPVGILLLSALVFAAGLWRLTKGT